MTTRQNLFFSPSATNGWANRLMPYLVGSVMLMLMIGVFITRAKLSASRRAILRIHLPTPPTLGQIGRYIISPDRWVEPVRMMLAVLIVICSLVLWAFSLEWVDVRSMNNLGLVSVLPVPVYVALAGLSLGFCLTLWGLDRTRAPVLLIYLLALIIMLYATPALVEQAPRFPATYWLAGHTEYLLTTGSVNPYFDAYFNWPGFFVLTGLLTKITGLSSVLAFAPWASFVYNLLYLGPMYMIFSAATTDRRTIWLGLWFFYITDWVWQDYFDPQGLNFFFYLVIFAILLKAFKASQSAFVKPVVVNERVTQTFPTLRRGVQTLRLLPGMWTRALVSDMRRGIMPYLGEHRSGFMGWLGRLRAWMALSDAPMTREQRRRQVALLFALLAIFALSVFSHPITPFFVLLGVTALTLFGRITPRWLPILLAVMIISWDFTAATPYLGGHLRDDLATFGNIKVVASANVTDRLSAGDPEHHFISQMRVIASAGIWGLAALGAVLRWHRKARWYNGDSSWGKGSLFAHDAPFVLLAVAPVIMVIAQPYGGEMAMRYYLFSLPIVAFFAAASFRSRFEFKSLRWLVPAKGPATVVGISVACLLLLASFMFARYGNENADYVTYNEFNAVTYLYNVAPPHSLLLQGWTGTPWRYQDLTKYTYSPLFPSSGQAAAIEAGDVQSILDAADSHDYPATYIIISRSQKAQAKMFYGVAPAAFDAIATNLLNSGKFTVIYENSDAEILMYLHPHPHNKARTPQDYPPLAGLMMPRGVS